MGLKEELTKEEEECNSEEEEKVAKQTKY